jgi:hypothetical protein
MRLLSLPDDRIPETFEPLLHMRDALEGRVHDYVTGYCLRALGSQRSLFPVADALTKEYAQLIAMSFQLGYGALLPHTLLVGHGVRLCRANEYLCAFSRFLEDFIRQHVYNAATLLMHGSDVYITGMGRLATSLVIREKWDLCIRSSLAWAAVDGVVVGKDVGHFTNKFSVLSTESRANVHVR